MHGKVETITPAIARRFLESNGCNRPISRMTITFLRSEIAAGRWRCNGEPFIVSNTDRLLEGQHRCHAIIMENKSIEAMVVRGVPDDAFDSMGQGKRRSVSDVLAMRKESNTSVLAGSIAWVESFGRGLAPRLTILSHAESLEILEKNPGLRASVALLRKKSKGLLSPSLLCAAHYLASKIDAVEADYFFESLVTGFDLSDGCPILALRERLIANAASKAKLNSNYIARLVIKAWNLCRHGKQAKRISIPDSGYDRDAFEPMV